MEKHSEKSISISTISVLGWKQRKWEKETVMTSWWLLSGVLQNCPTEIVFVSSKKLNFVVEIFLLRLLSWILDLRSTFARGLEFVSNTFNQRPSLLLFLQCPRTCWPSCEPSSRFRWAAESNGRTRSTVRGGPEESHDKSERGSDSNKALSEGPSDW